MWMSQNVETTQHPKHNESITPRIVVISWHKGLQHLKSCKESLGHPSLQSTNVISARFMQSRTIFFITVQRYFSCYPGSPATSSILAMKIELML